MPADNSLPQSSPLNSDASRPYTCHARPKPPGAEFAINYGYCRHSLDYLVGCTDPRCPAECRHKAPLSVMAQFQKMFQWRGAAAAAKYAREQRGGKS